MADVSVGIADVGFFFIKLRAHSFHPCLERTFGAHVDIKQPRSSDFASCLEQFVWEQP